MPHVYYPNETLFPGFLRSWRVRRRLSQLDLSLESGMSQRHISFLETGRSKPSRTAISQLAEALEMPAAEVDAMLVSAGYAARSSRREWNEDVHRAVDASITHVLMGHEPFPAVSIDRIWNLKQTNSAATRFFTLLGAVGHSNLLREIIYPGELRSSIRNWDDTAQSLLRMMELEAARRPNDKEAQSLLVELNEIEGVAEAISRRTNIDPKPVLSIEFEIEGQILSLFSMIATIGMSADAAIDDTRIETLLPANDETRAWFEQRFSS